jgi:hypothetical protein
LLTVRGHNARMTRKRSKALWAVAALLALNAVLFVAQPSLAVPGHLGNYFFGPKLVRAEVLIQEGGVVHDYRIDRGVLRGKPAGAVVLREHDGSIQTIAVAPTAVVTLGGHPTSLAALRRGMTVTVIRDGDAPAIEVRAGGK